MVMLYWSETRMSVMTSMPDMLLCRVPCHGGHGIAFIQSVVVVVVCLFDCYEDDDRI